MTIHSSRGVSLVELIVALLVLELAGATALALALGAERLGAATLAVTAVDRGRWEGYRATASDPTCRDAPVAHAAVLVFPAAPGRHELSLRVLCGP